MKRIFIADDHESVLRRVRAMVESHPDWQVCGEAVNGREAVAKVHELRPDLLILDFAMPHLDGLRTAAEIHKLLREMPIVMFTMYGSAVTHEVQKYGITRLVDKSQSDDLTAAIEELLLQKQPPEQAQPPITVLTTVVDSVSEAETNPIRKIG